jgi:hypothetical protein
MPYLKDMLINATPCQRLTNADFVDTFPVE